jgi:hypothetical protein
MPTPTLVCLTFMVPTLYLLRTMLLYSQWLSPPDPSLQDTLMSPRAGT